MSIIINGQRTYLSLPRKEDPKEFKRLSVSKKRNDLRDFLELYYQKVLTAETELLKNGEAITPDSLKARLQGNSTSYLIKDLFDGYYTILKKRVGINLTAPVYRKYEIVRDLFYKTIAAEKQVKDITKEVISNFYADLNSKYESTTSAAMMVKLKSVIMFAIDNGKLQINPFNGIKISKKTKEVEFLTTEELNRIKSKKLDGRLSKVRDLFLFQCYTGLAYIDMANLTREDFQQNEENQYFIKKHRAKTGVGFTTVLLKEAQEIVEKYDFVLPVLSNQKYNSYLKEIADLCKITKPMHTHIGRHTCATQLLNRGMSIETVAKVLGHSNIKQTQHYSKLVDKTVFSAFKKMD